MQILGIDVGGTTIKAALVETSTGALLSEHVRIVTPKPATPQAIGETLKGMAEHFGHQGPIGVGFPAAIQHGIARTAANIDKAFIGLPIAAYFTQLSGRPTHVVNDADAAGLAEMRFGAGKNASGVVLMITIGTGLGTALFTNGQLLPNSELGHILLDNGVEAERYASESVRVVQKLKWKEWGERFNQYLLTWSNCSGRTGSFSAVGSVGNWRNSSRCSPPVRRLSPPACSTRPASSVRRCLPPRWKADAASHARRALSTPLISFSSVSVRFN